MKILVFGGSGFIGSNFINYCFKNDNYIILNVDSLTYASSNNSISVNDNYSFIKGDICNRHLMSKIIIDFKPDCIINFAAESHVDNSIENSDEFIHTNINGTHTLLKMFYDLAHCTYFSASNCSAIANELMNRLTDSLSTAPPTVAAITL